MSWSIAEVARSSGVTSRTLRHYDAIGLLPPAGVAAGGHRYYEDAQLLRLQQILLMRRLGLGLPDIRAVLERQVDRVDSLRAHARQLHDQRDRLDTLIRTVERTITALENGDSVMTSINKPENLFEGFDLAADSAHAQAARDRWPREWAQAKEFTDTLSAEDSERMQRETTAQIVRMGELMAAGKPADDPAVQAEVDAHYRGLCRLWTPNRAAFTALGNSYLEDPQWRTAYDRVAEGLAAFQRDAMTVYADTRLR